MEEFKCHIGEKTQIEIGLYPQTHVDDPSIIDTLNALAELEPNGCWYLFDGKYYANAIALPLIYGDKYADGTTIKEDSLDWFECEPIKWRVLQKEGGEVYLISDVILLDIPAN